MTQQAVELLTRSWRARRRLSELPAVCRPDEPGTAYACQDALLEQLQGEYGPPVGYKIGCTNEKAQKLLGIDRPFYGRLLAKLVYQSPARLAADKFFMRVIEPEFAFQMARDLPPRDEPYEQAEVAAAVATVVPAIEIVDSRFENWTEVGGPSIIADNGSNGAWVCGPEYRGDWQTLELSSHTVELVVNDTLTRQGRGELVMGHPLNALTWLANSLREQGRGLRAGESVSTGTCCEVYPAQAGDRIRADFGPLGVVELEFKSLS